MTYNVFSGMLNPTQSKPCMTSGHKHKVATISTWTHPSCDISRHYYFYCSLHDICLNLQIMKTCLLALTKSAVHTRRYFATIFARSFSASAYDICWVATQCNNHIHSKHGNSY